MNNSPFVRSFDSITDLFGDGERFFDRDRTASDPVRQRLAFDQFEDEESRVVRFPEIVYCRDIGMVQRGENLGLSLKSADAIGILRELSGQDLDGDFTLELQIAGSI